MESPARIAPGHIDSELALKAMIRSYWRVSLRLCELHE
jgi:hypothetical protein